MPGKRAVGDRLVLQREPERPLEVAVHVAERHAVVRRRRLELARAGQLLDVEVAPRRLRDRDLLVGVLLQSREQAVGGEDQQARVLERHQEHQHVAVVALAADLVRVDACGLVAVVAVGDQELGVSERALERGDPVRVANAPERVARAVVVGRLGERLLARHLAERLARAAARVGEQAEDGGEVGARGAREAEPVLPRPGMGALVWPDAPGAVVVHAHAREEPGAGALAAVRGGVVLAQHPHGRLVLLDQHARLAPLRERLGRALVALGQVELDDVVLVSARQLGPHGVVDDVVGRGDRGRRAARRPRCRSEAS